MLRPSLLVTVLAPLAAACTNARFAPLDAGVEGAVDRDLGQDRASDDLAVGPDSAAEVPSVCPSPAVPGCLPRTEGACDPVCQTGGCDFCVDKCSYVIADGALVAACRPTGSRRTAEACSIIAAGVAEQADDCAPGNICLPPFIGDSTAFCFALCRDAIDCPYGVACAPRPLSAAGGSVSVCDPPYDQCGRDGTCCDPVTASGCPSERICLLVAPDPGTDHSRTVCELSYGDGRNGAPCSTARDCQRRNVCVNGHCQQVCSSSAPCSTGGACVPYGAEFGYCP